MLIDKGYKKQITITLYEDELEVLDLLRAKHRCSRAAIIGAWCDENRESATSLTGKVKPGRRPGGGRRAMKGTD